MRKKIICVQLYFDLCINSGLKMKMLLLAQHSNAMTFHQREVISGWDEN